MAHYLSGVIYSSAGLKDALTDASARKIGSPIQQFFLLCFHYSPITGKYGPLIMIVVRVFGATLVLALGAFIVSMIRRDTKEKIPEPHAPTGTG